MRVREPQPVFKQVFTCSKLVNSSMSLAGRWCLFPFRKRSLPFLTVDPTIGNQAFSHNRCQVENFPSPFKMSATKGTMRRRLDQLSKRSLAVVSLRS